MKNLKAPRHLKAETRRWWESVTSSWDLEEHHIRLLTLAGESWDRGQQAREILQKKGLTFDDFRGQPKSRPEIAIERDSRTAFARLVREIGLDVQSPEDTRPPRLGGQN